MTSIETGLQIQSTITSKGQVELSLVTVDTPVPGPGDVVIRMQAAPINPSDLGLLFSSADLSTLSTAGTADHPMIVADMPAAAMKLVTVAPRIDEPRPAGNEGAGVVVAAGDSPEARALMGKTVAFMGGPSYTQFRCIAADQCLVLPDDVTPAEGASSFVNPLTVLGMVETMRLEGHSALVHTVGASNLGQMLIRHCRDEGVPLVNIVRKPEQVALLKSLGADYICDSSAETFTDDLTNALVETGATLAFDAIGGGKLASRILNCMEVASSKRVAGYGGYGTAIHKQVYIYGGLDTNPTEVRRTFGMAWGMGGWLLPYFLDRVGPEKTSQLKARVAAEIKTTFASHYTDVISLKEALNTDIVKAYSRQASGEKYLVNPNG